MAESQENPNVVEEEEEECPKCPPKGAPAWMATFADMATLLMAFFVLILSFAEFNVPKFKQISGSMKNAFGIQRVIPVVEPPKGTTILSLNFSPNPTPAVQDNLKQQTTETDQPKVELQTKQEDNTKDDGETEDAKELAKNIQEAIARGDITVEALGSKVVVNFTPTEADEKELPQLLQETLNAVESVKAASGKSESEILIGGLEKQLADLASASSQKGKNEAEGEDGESVGQSEQSQSAKEEAKKAELAEDKLKIALKQEIGEGLVNVDREDDKVIITVGSAGAFKSGSAELTNKAREIMSKIAEQNKKGRSEILVMGHTDNVPLTFGSNYRDNWDLAAARSASVVQQLSRNDTLDPKRMKAISYGETRPVESNDTSQGRAKNRRIEIEINY